MEKRFVYILRSALTEQATLDAEYLRIRSLPPDDPATAAALEAFADRLREHGERANR